jgi:hypothetical protein
MIYLGIPIHFNKLRKKDLQVINAKMIKKTDLGRGPVQFRWMYSQERELKKLRATVRNKARVEGCIADAFTCKEIMNFSSMYFSCANNVNAHTLRHHIEEVVPLSELKIFQWNGKGVGATSAHFVTDEE